MWITIFLTGSIGNFNNHILVNEFEGIASLQNTEESVLGTSMEVDGDMLVERVGAKSLCHFLLLSVKPPGFESQWIEWISVWGWCNAPN